MAMSWISMRHTKHYQAADGLAVHLPSGEFFQEPVGTIDWIHVMARETGASRQVKQTDFNRCCFCQNLFSKHTHKEKQRAMEGHVLRFLHAFANETKKTDWLWSEIPDLRIKVSAKHYFHDHPLLWFLIHDETARKTLVLGLEFGHADIQSVLETEPELTLNTQKNKTTEPPRTCNVPSLVCGSEWHMAEITGCCHDCAAYRGSSGGDLLM